MFSIAAKQGCARAGQFLTNHGAIHTPVFMNVATQAAIKGGLSSIDLESVRCQVALANTYHLHIRPGDKLIADVGGLHRFMSWDHPILTDSGGFQIFSLAGLRKISEEGVTFMSHVDGRKIFMSPEDSIQIQANLGTDIAMAFDECIEIPSPRDYVEKSCDRTYRWLVRCKDALEKADCANPDGHPSTACPVLFGINQGALYPSIRIAHMKKIAELDLPGYAIGGLSVGETAQQMYEMIETVEQHMPQDRPRYLMGVGTPQNIIEAVARGIDFFDCVLPARNGRHGRLYTWSGSININNEKHKDDDHPIDETCDCAVCRTFSRAYIRHLFKAGEILGLRLAVHHNLYFYNTLMMRIRDSIMKGEFETLRKEFKEFEKS